MSTDSTSFLEDVFKLITQDIDKTDAKVVEFVQPEDLEARLDMAVGEQGASREELLDLCQKAIRYSIRTSSPYFFNQLYAKRDTRGLAATWLTEHLNTNSHTYECAPVFILSELYVIEALGRLASYKDPDGIFLPGGSLGNFFALHLARFRMFKHVKEDGMFGLKRMTAFCSEAGHYSTWKAAGFLGFGTNSVIYVKTDARGRMSPEDLEHKIAQSKERGEVPCFVNATCGTTVLGSFDCLDALADICDKHKLWLHCDASWGGGVLFSETHKKLLTGIHRTNSMVISLHKLMAVPIQCSVILVQGKGLLEECNGSGASYLFQQDKHYDPHYDIGDKSIQCGRKGDAFKFLLTWKARGKQGMEDYVDKAFRLASYFTECLKEREGFRLVLPEYDYVNISFWYIPPSLRGQPETQEWWQKVAQVAPTIKTGMVSSGSMMIGYQPLESKQLVNFFRIIIHHSDLNEGHLDFVLDEIERLGKDL